MVNDSVREELAARISSLAVPETKPAAPKKKVIAKADPKPAKQKKSKEIQLKPPPEKIITKPTNTAEIFIKKTNRTLIEFQTEKTRLPEWRLQLQNVVQQRKQSSQAASHENTGSRSMAMTVDGYETANAPNRTSQGMIDAVLPDGSDNQLVASALKRIETSRQKYLVEDVVETPRQREITNRPNAEPKEFPFKIASQPEKSRPVTKMKATQGRVAIESKPTLVRETKVETARTTYDTNELDPEFVEANVSSSFEKRTVKTEEIEQKSDPPKTKVSKPEKELVVDSAETDVDEYDDVASFALRFNSGLFDLIVGSFASLILLSPLMLLGGSWFTVAGAFGFLFTLAIVMFIYLTTTIGVFGKSFGMHLFSLEMIDISGEEYPTFHQAAVSSSVYLLSLAFAGIGFLTCLIDEDARAIHDLASGTIVVREF